MDNLVKCGNCSLEECYYISSETEYKICMSCGYNYTSDKTIEDLLPEIYKDLSVTDDEGNKWYPSYLNIEGKGVLFVDGKSVENWKWALVPIVEIDGSKKLDMSNVQYFDKNMFPVASLLLFSLNI